MNLNTPELRIRCAAELQSAAGRVSQMTAFVGLDGFVDEILHVVDKRQSITTYDRMPTIAKLAEKCGANKTLPLANLQFSLGNNVHYLPTYQG